MRTDTREPIYQNSRGHITIEQTGKSQSYVVWLNSVCSAMRKATIGVNVLNAFDRAKGILESASF